MAARALSDERERLFFRVQGRRLADLAGLVALGDRVAEGNCDLRLDEVAATVRMVLLARLRHIDGRRGRGGERDERNDKQDEGHGGRALVHGSPFFPSAGDCYATPVRLLSQTYILAPDPGFRKGKFSGRPRRFWR